MSQVRTGAVPPLADADMNAVVRAASRAAMLPGMLDATAAAAADALLAARPSDGAQRDEPAEAARDGLAAMRGAR